MLNWIPTTVKLPMVGQDVLITIKETDQVVSAFLITGKTAFFTSDRKHAVIVPFVAAWAEYNDFEPSGA